MDKRGAFSFLSGLFKPKLQGNCYSRLNSIQVKDIMVIDVLCTQKTERLVEAAHMMIGAHASCLVVLDRDKPIGIITERDFVKKLPMEKDHSAQMIVDDLMTKKLFTIHQHANLVEAQKIMREHNFRKLIIVENDLLKGIITQTDLCWAVADLDVHYEKPPLVRDFMSRKPLIISKDEKFSKAKKLMMTKDVGSVIVVDKKEVQGMFTEFDLVSEFFMNPNRLRNSYMKDLMTSPVICISPDFDVFQINSIMLGHNFRRLPVIEGNKIMGIITQTDVVKAMYEFIEKNKDAMCNKNLKSKEPFYCVKKEGNIIVYEMKKEAPMSSKSIK